MMNNLPSMAPKHLAIVKYCAEECERQGSGELSVYDMVNAWEYARADSSEKVNLDFIEKLGTIVEPIDNKNGFRTIAIGVGNGFTWIEKAQWERVPELLTLLLESYYDGLLIPVHELAETAEDQFYFEYEEIHPFRDGNGRTGKILYNYLCNTLDSPIMVPNFWNILNP